MGWRGPLTHRQLLVWMAWQKLWREGDKPDLSMDGCVPAEVQRRWAGKVYGAAAAVARGEMRRKQAQSIAEKTGRPLHEVEAELLDMGKRRGARD